MTGFPIDPKLDLVHKREVDVSPSLIWTAWTTPKHLMPWFCPKPWLTVECEIDLRPGGLFRTVMQSPEGEKFSNAGCYLEIVENQRLTWTDALEAGFRPASAINPQISPVGHFTATILIEAAGTGSLYTAIARHSSEAGRKAHEEMGFHDGWGAALDQPIAYVKASSIT